MQQVNIAHSILRSVSNMFHFIILSLPKKYVVLYMAVHRIFQNEENGEIGEIGVY